MGGLPRSFCLSLLVYSLSQALARACGLWGNFFRFPPGPTGGSRISRDGAGRAWTSVTGFLGIRNARGNIACVVWNRVRASTAENTVGLGTILLQQKYKKLPLMLGLHQWLGYKINPPPSLISAAGDRVEKCMDGANSLDFPPLDALAPGPLLLMTSSEALRGDAAGLWSGSS